MFSALNMTMIDINSNHVISTQPEVIKNVDKPNCLTIVKTSYKKAFQYVSLNLNYYCP